MNHIIQIPIICMVNLMTLGFSLLDEQAHLRGLQLMLFPLESPPSTTIKKDEFYKLAYYLLIWSHS